MGEPVTAAGNPGSLLDYIVALPVPNRERATGKIVAKAWYCGSKDTPMIECAWAIAFDGPVEPGYSGGPLVDAEGRVIAITIAKTEESIPLSDGGVMSAGTGIALPAAVVWSEFRRLVPVEP